MAEHKLEASQLLAMLDESIPPGVLDDFLDDLASFNRPAREWSSMVRRRVCPVCGGQIPKGQGVVWSTCDVTVLHRGDCCRVAEDLSRSYRHSPRGRWRTRTEWRRLIDTVWKNGLTRPASRETGETDETF
jgi:hypothetical protein